MPNQQRPVNAGRRQVAEHFETYRQDILSFLRSRVATPEQADDLLQQTFLRVLQRTNWAEVEHPKSYLKTTARHVLADFYRQRNARHGDAVVEFEEDQHSDDTYSPGRLLQSHDYMRLLADALQSLSPQVQKAFILSRVYGHTYAEVGRALSISPRTVEKHVAKGLATCFEHVSKIELGADKATGSTD